MEGYKVWCPDTEEEADAKRFDAFDAASAAQLYAERDTDGCDDGMYEDGCELHVRDATGLLTKVSVRTELSVDYRGRIVP